MNKLMSMLLIGHIDVVEAPRATWSEEAGTRDGVQWLL